MVRELIKNDPYEVEMFECLLDFYTGKGFTKTKFTPLDLGVSPEMFEHIEEFHGNLSKNEPLSKIKGILNELCVKEKLNFTILIDKFGARGDTLRDIREIIKQTEDKQ